MRELTDFMSVCELHRLSLDAMGVFCRRSPCCTTFFAFVCSIFLWRKDKVGLWMVYKAVVGGAI